MVVCVHTGLCRGLLPTCLGSSPPADQRRCQQRRAFKSHRLSWTSGCPLSEAGDTDVPASAGCLLPVAVPGGPRCSWTCQYTNSPECMA